MDIKVKSGNILKEKSNAAVLTVFEGEEPAGLVGQADKALDGAIARAINQGEFTGKKDETIVFRAGRSFDGGPERLLLAGLGKKEKFFPDNLRRAAGSSAAALRALNLKEVTVSVPDAACGLTPHDTARLLAEGSILGLYVFDQFKSADPKKKELRRITLITEAKAVETQTRKGSETGQVIAESVCMARDMINTPANAMTPTVMAERARSLARESGLRFRALDREACKKLGMGAYLAVASGSVQPPRFITLEYRGARKRGASPTVLVGKAITFDSGGISIKPSEGMEKMKYDMAGGASVMAVIRIAAALRLPVNLTVLIPATENLPSGSAYKPGDVVRAMNGKTIEIISTDAEGRMVLADALCYAKRYKPEAIIDIATLTGACVIALGDLAIGMMGNDPALLTKIKEAGLASHERVWELPMWDEYLDRMKGDVSDLKNVGGRQAATITAGKFLQEFAGDTPWVHLDIAGTAWEEKGQPYIPKGARGTGIRLITEYLMSKAL